MHAMKELNVARDDRQAIGKRSPLLLVTPLGGKVFWVEINLNLIMNRKNYKDINDKINKRYKNTPYISKSFLTTQKRFKSVQCNNVNCNVV